MDPLYYTEKRPTPIFFSWLGHPRSRNTFPLINNVSKITAQRQEIHLRLETFFKQLKTFSTFDVEQAMSKLEIIKKIYTNDDVLAYANLARIDAVYGLFSCEDRYLTYLSLNNGPGWNDVYLYHKLSYNCDALSMSLPEYKLSNLNGFLFNPRSLKIITGQGATADLRHEHQSFLDEFYMAYPGVDFALCSLPPTTSIDPSGREVDKQASEALQFLLANLYIVFSTMSERATVIFELPGSNSKTEQQMIFACARNFAQISFFKPISSDLSSTQRYLICQDFSRDENVLQDIKLVMQNIFSLGIEDDLIGTLPANFLAWYETVVIELEKVTESYYQNLLDILQGKDPKLNTYNQSFLWAACQLVK